MFVLMEGVILRRTTSGFGPFSRQHWESEPFVWKFAQDGDTEHSEEIEARRNDVAGKITVEATVRTVPVYLADFDSSKPCQPVDFNLMSVAGYQIAGKATLVGLAGKVVDEDAYAA